ncbi:hypothetical protein C4Q31_00560 [Leptospira borgpetersenii serovar Ceylonica]|nr:hypothetical protein C4Q31_00560 [Leptospira borgpetersenii serovar Ceylonica]
MLQQKESIKLLNSNYIILSVVLRKCGTLPIEPFFYNNRVAQKLIFHPFLFHENDRLKQFY